jgi:hypothetical protein
VHARSGGLAPGEHIGAPLSLVTPFEVILFKVAEYPLFAVSHSHGGEIPYCGIEVLYNKNEDTKIKVINRGG